MLFATGSIIAVSGYIFTREYASALQSRSLAIATGLKVQLERVLQLGIPLENLIGFEEQAQEAVKAYEGIDYAMVIALDGRILFHSDPARMGKVIAEPEILEAARKGEQGVTRQFDDLNGHDDFGAVVPVLDARGTHLASIVVDVPAHQVASKARRLGLINAGLGLLFLVVGLGALIATLSALVTNPLNRFITTLREIRLDTTNLTRRVAVAPQEDMGRLAETFNELMQELQSTTVSKTQFEHSATHDALTGLPNRVLLRDRLENALAYARRYGRRTTIAFLDLDNFKIINDSLGHDLGDDFLKAVAERLKNCARELDTVSRISGDEFVIVFFDQPNQDDTVIPLLERLQHAVTQPVSLGSHEYTLTASIGFAIFPQDGADGETLLRNADEAMYRAKELGRNNFQSFSEDLHARFTESLALHNGLRRAIENREFVVHYQPQTDLRSGRIVGVEALVRWQHPEQGLVPPDQFIPAAEDTGLIAPIGEFVLRAACAQAKAWHEAGLPPLRMAVNLSPRQFWQPDLLDIVRSALSESGMNAAYLELELTESLIIRSVEDAVKTMHALRTMGVGLSIDDFGTGYSSLSSLKRFPISRLKIAQQFLHEIPADPNSIAIAHAVISLGHDMKLSVIAEGVETPDQLHFLRAAGCDEIQGYLVSRPVPAEKIPALVKATTLEALLS